MSQPILDFVGTIAITIVCPGRRVPRLVHGRASSPGFHVVSLKPCVLAKPEEFTSTDATPTPWCLP